MRRVRRTLIVAGATLLLATPGASAFEQKVTASDGVGVSGPLRDLFGRAVAVDGDTAVVGAPGRDEERGAVYVFKRTDDVWTQTAVLTASDRARTDRLGWSVAIDGDTIVAGAPYDNSGRGSGTGREGSVYTFARTGPAARTETAKLTASDATFNAQLGWSVAIDSGAIVAGAPSDAALNTNRGAVYTFARTGGSRTDTAKLTASDGAAQDLLGTAVAIDGDVIVAGAPFEGPGVNDVRGAVYTFGSTGGNRTETAKLTASDGVAGDGLGAAVAIEGDAIVAGAPFDNGPEARVGGVYAFARTGAAARTQTAKLTASSPGRFDALGTAVAIDGGTIVAGVPADNGSQASGPGSVFTFAAAGGDRTETGELAAGDGAFGDRLGTSVGIDAGTIVAGDTLDDVGANVDQGSASIFFEPVTTPDLAIALTDAADPVPAGSDVKYTLSVRNNGTSVAIGVRTTDVLPPGVTFKALGTSTNCTNSAGTVTCDFGNVAVGATERVTLVVTADQPGTLSNTASVDGAQQDPVPGNDSDTETTQVIGQGGGGGGGGGGGSAGADLAIDKRADADAVAVGDTLTYTLAVSNAGPESAPDVTVVDALPPGVSFVSTSPGCRFTSGTVTCDYGTVPAGPAVQTAQVVVRAQAAGAVANTATVSGGRPDPNGADNTDTVTTQVTARGGGPVPSSSAGAPAAPVQPGSSATAAAPAAAASAPPRFPAKLQVLRARVTPLGRLDAFATISAEASGLLRARFQAAGRTVALTAPVDAAKRRVRVLGLLTRSQARLGTGILTLDYPGDSDTEPQQVRLRAAPNRADLVAGRPRVEDGHLRATGTIDRRAVGVVRIQLRYQPAGGLPQAFEYHARIVRGTYALDVVLPPGVADGIRQRVGTVHAYTLFTGYLPGRMRGEMRSHQVLPAP